MRVYHTAGPGWLLSLYVLTLAAGCLTIFQLGRAGLVPDAAVFAWHAGVLPVGSVGAYVLTYLVDPGVGPPADAQLVRDYGESPPPSEKVLYSPGDEHS